MDIWMIIPATVVAVVMVFAFGYRYIRSTSRRENLRGLMQQRLDLEDSAPPASLEEVDDIGLPIDETQKKSPRKSGDPSYEELMFYAGLFSDKQKQDFRRLQILLPVCLAVVALLLATFTGRPQHLLLMPLGAVILGTLIPKKTLEKKRKRRDEDIMFYLPLVIEQVSIGVSSSLDIGPCLARVVEMADERDTHNPVTELLRYAQFFIKSGVSLQDALQEVGRLSGNNDIQHSFKALAQVARYGGEISKQLQDLSEAVSSARETRVEEKIKKLELIATAPVGLVFLGFIIILLVGFGTSMTKGMGG